MAGVTDTGFEAETTDSLKTAIENDLKSSFGTSFNVRPTSVAGVLIGTLSKKLADLWAAGLSVYNAQYPETAFGASLSQLALLTGVQRLEATRSRVVCGVTGTPNTVIPEGSRIRDSDTGSFWRTKIGGGDIVIPSVSSTTASVESEELGEVIGVAGTLDVIDTVIAGWNAVNNPLDATLGRLDETDAELRLRRAALLTQEGKGTVDSIRADVFALDGMREVTVFENVTLLPDGDGIPGKSFEVVLRQDGSIPANTIAQTIWDSKPAGISAYGSLTGKAVDVLAHDQIVAWTQAEEVPIYVAISATTASGFGLTGVGVANIKSAMVAYGATLRDGDDVIREHVRAQGFQVVGVIDVPDARIATTPTPTGTTNIPITIRQIATFDTSHVTVTLL
jgi:uncharacterized phage protein gp47/JayE